ncbi:hypothetical protein E8E14_005538 [Neopestalotiopsis sp. 37M]|nr:hypothetical protein E8E14_005538 [Neopestalotiopsis sp. 37M]
MAPMTPADRVCVSCQTEDGKYKCPRCMKYTKKHKEEHPPEEDKPKPTPAEPAAGDTASSGDGEQPDEFTKLFNKYPALATYLNQIADCTEPPSNDPDGDAGHGQGHGQGHGGQFRKKPRHNHNKPWTREVGLQNGLHKLRQLRDQDTTGALREFGELVLHLNAQKQEEEARKKDDDQRDAELIGQLIREERD